VWIRFYKEEFFMSFLDLAKKRYSCRKLSAQAVEGEKLRKILEAGNLAPTAHNNQPLHIWLLESAEAMEKLSQTTSCIFGAPVAFANEAMNKPLPGYLELGKLARGRAPKN